jgi:hypothetical protein
MSTKVKDEFKKTDILLYQFRGQGQKIKSVITLPGAIKLMMFLPGAHAKRMRSIAADILTRYLHGDLTLCVDIALNKRIGAEKACASLMSNALDQAMKDRNAMPPSGWVYGTKSDAFPGLIKIGRAQALDERLSSGNTFCAPAKHVLVAAAPSFYPKRDEKGAHAHFAAQRRAGEFFAVTEEEVQTFFNTKILSLYNEEMRGFILTLQMEGPN